MNVSSLELCKELFKLSGWVDDTVDCFWHTSGELSYGDNYKEAIIEAYVGMVDCPAYSLGYLIRRLPQKTELKKLKYKNMEDVPEGGNHAITAMGYVATYRHEINDNHSSGIPKIVTYSHRSKSPEDCLAQLAIELFKSGVLENKNA